MTVTLRLALGLPRSDSTVPFVRRLLAQALTTLGVADDCRDDICLILTEACANVVDHARNADSYEVSATLSADRCVVAVADAGAAVNPARLVPGPRPSVWADRGRGLHIIRVLADEVRVTPGAGGGLVLEAVVVLRWRDPAAGWARAATGSDLSPPLFGDPSEPL